MEIGPLDPVELAEDLERDATRDLARRLLSTLVEEVSVRGARRRHRLRLEKRVP